MSEQEKTGGNHQSINCGETMDISTVAELHSQLTEALESGKPVILGAEKVDRADTAALQLLSVFFNDAGAKQQDIQWNNPSDNLRRSAALLGLSNILKLETIVH